MRILLQQWLNENRQDSDVPHDQALFVRNVLPRMLYSVPRDYFENYPVMAIGDHVSCGRRLAVYELTLQNGARLTLRGNLYNWIVTVESPVEVRADFLDLLDPNACHHPATCEGFPMDRVLGPMSEDRRRFTVSVGSDHDLYAFCFILGHALGLRKQARR